MTTTMFQGFISQLTERLWVHDEWMGACGYPSVTDLDEDAVALVVVLAVAVRLFQQALRVADQTTDATARHRLEVCARAKRLCPELLHTDRTFYKYRPHRGPSHLEISRK